MWSTISCRLDFSHEAAVSEPLSPTGSRSSGFSSPGSQSPTSARPDRQSEQSVDVRQEAPAASETQKTDLKRNARYKTTLCRHFERIGRCDAGEHCAFAHGVSELRVPQLHPKYKTRLCADFWRSGHCAMGATCHFIHDERFGQMLAIRERQLAANADLRDAVFLARVTRLVAGFDVHACGARCTPFTGLGALEWLYQPSEDSLADAPLFDMWANPFGQLFWSNNYTNVVRRILYTVVLFSIDFIFYCIVLSTVALVMLYTNTCKC